MRRLDEANWTGYRVLKLYDDDPRKAGCWGRAARASDALVRDADRAGVDQVWIALLRCGPNAGSANCCRSFASRRSSRFVPISTVFTS
jgi:hypothetical protein